MVMSPPLGEIHCPVVNELSSDARWRAVAAISAAVPLRRSGVIPTMGASRASSTLAVIGVSITPGAMALMRIPMAPNSRAAARVKARTAPLAAA